MLTCVSRFGTIRRGLPDKTDGLYHLERQSIRLMDTGSARMALTYLNCITFNERWARHIAPPEIAPELSPPIIASRGRREKQAEA